MKEEKSVSAPVEMKVGEDYFADFDFSKLEISLEEMFKIKITNGSLFYGETRRRVNVEFTTELRQTVFDHALRMHELYNNGITPLPVYKSHCKSCSLIDICLPQNLSGKIKASDYLRNSLETD